ncbi:MAG: HAMP domain-containing histidine kinase [Anaerolineae bacterium]|nr:HAMP domain-containing histidine kinase [Anaerolineae bacterium]NUQ02675.1 HAMP domain-containing histidine kinase [Anaerolineae bacterium]
MWRELFSGLLPDQDNLLPAPVQATAQAQIDRYWRTRGWQLVLGEVILWTAAVYQDVPYPWAYGILAGAVAFIYGVGWFGGASLFWMISLIAVFGLQGMVILGLGPVTALTTLIPYTISGMLYSGRRRGFVQVLCIAAFWVNLVFEVLPGALRLEPSRSIIVSYDILLAAYTFQTLRFLSHLSIDISTAHVAEEVRHQSQRFLARVSHELRTPLNSVLGFAKLLHRSASAEPGRAYLEQIISEGEHLDRLVGDLLDSARLSSGSLSLNYARCSINALCAQAADEARRMLHAGVRLETEFDPALTEIDGDPLRLRQAISNLTTNAAKYTRQGQITIRTVLREDRLRIEVQDTGVGIAESQAHLVFLPFVRLSTDSSGAGLGLVIALEIARLHGGDILLSSQPDIGSTFTLELPVNRAS